MRSNINKKNAWNLPKIKETGEKPIFHEKK